LRSRSAPSQQTERQLAAVVAADIAGYSRLMGADEEGTLAALKACRSELIDPTIARHRGRIVKTTGDGLLIEFSSPVEAVRWAVGMQHGMIERNAGIPNDRQIQFRVGINLGDVIVDDKDLYGDAVNIAARLETLAEPGGICISRTMRDQIRDRVDLPFEDAGEQSVKNITRPIRVYSLSTSAVAALPRMVLPAVPQARRSRSTQRLVSLAVVGALIVGTGAWWLWPSLKAPPASVSRPSPEKSSSAAARRLSIVVLPFANMSGDKDQQYFADGITEDLTTDLSRIADSFVISRNTAFTYKDKPVDTKQIGQDLGVHYVLEGSVQRSGQQVRINAQLIDAESDAHIWADRFERDIGDLFTLQSEVTGRIANTLKLELVTAETARPIANPDALDYILRGRAARNKPATAASLAEAIGFFEQALALDPHSVEAQSQFALALATRVGFGLTGSDAKAADITRAEALISQVLSLSPDNAVAHSAKGALLVSQTRFAEAIPEYEAVVAADRNAANAIATLARLKAIIGQSPPKDVIPSVEQAIRLSPRDPQLWYWDVLIARQYALQLRDDESLVWYEKALSANPTGAVVHVELAANYANKGDIEHAAAELAEAQRLTPDGRYSSIARLRAVIGPCMMSAANCELRETLYFGGLRKAGMPEE
jgi:adenylate cyclase